MMSTVTLKRYFKFERLKKKKILLLNPVHQLHCIWIIEFSQLGEFIHHSWPELKLKTKQNQNQNPSPHPQLSLRLEGKRRNCT